MVNVAFRLTLVLLFIGVVHGRSNFRQDHDRREDRSYVDKTRDRLRSDVNEFRDQRDQNSDRRDQDDDQSDQDDRRERHQRMNLDEKKHREEEEKRRDRRLRLRKDDYQSEGTHECREQPYDRKEYRNDVQRESKESDEMLRSEQYNPKVIDKTQLRQDQSNLTDAQLIEIIQKYRLRNRNDKNKTSWGRSQDQNQQQEVTIKDDVEKRRRLYRERRERERSLRQANEERECLQRLEEAGSGDDRAKKYRLSYQNQDRKQTHRGRSDYNVDFGNRYNYRSLSPQKILLLGVSKPPSDIHLRGENKNEIQLKDQIIVYDDGRPRRRNENDQFNVDPKDQDKTDLRQQVNVKGRRQRRYDDDQTKNPSVKDLRQRRDGEDETKKHPVEDLRQRRDGEDQTKKPSVKDRRQRRDVEDQTEKPVEELRQRRDGDDQTKKPPVEDLRERRDGEDETKKPPVKDRRQRRDVNNYRSYQDDVAELQGNNFIENLQLNDLALEKMLNVIQNVTRGNIKAFYELEILNVLDELTADGLCHKNDIDYYWRYDSVISLAISETWLNPLKTALNVFIRIMDIQAAIQDIRGIIEDIREECYYNDGVLAAQCNELIAERILESPDRDLLVYEAKNLELMAQTARLYLVDFKPEFERAVFFKNVFTYFSKSEKQIKVFVDKLVKARAHASVDVLDC